MLQTVRAGGTQHSHEMLDFSANKAVLNKGIIDIPSGSFLVEEQSTPDMSVKIGLGNAYLPLADNSIAFPIRNYSTAESVIITNNASGNSRIDAIVLYVDLSETPNSDSSNVAKVASVDGTPAASPTAPSDGDIESEIGASNPYIRLADVTVANGATSILNANITDKRNTEEFYYGLATGGGWEVANDPMSFATTTTIEIPNDKTDIYKANLKLKVTNDGSEKQFKVSEDSTYDSGTNLTTVTVTGEVLLVSGAITGQELSWADCPKGWKSWISNFQARVYQESEQVLVDATNTKLTFDVTDYDPNSMLASNALYAQVDGFYDIRGKAFIFDGSNKLIGSIFSVYVNGVRDDKVRDLPTAGAGNSSYLTQQLCYRRFLNKGDYVELYLNTDTIDSTAVATGTTSDEKNFLEVLFASV